MKNLLKNLIVISVAGLAVPGIALAQKQEETFGFVDLFNGKDLSGWIAPEGEHTWKVIDGVLDYSAMGGHLVSQKEYGDYILQFEWRFKQTTGDPYNAKVFNPDGTQKVDADGNPMTVPIANADSGVYTRGEPSSQINLWCWPCGSGQIWANHRSPDPELVRGALPLVNADNPVGEWNSMQISMIGEAVTVVLNGRLVIDSRMPGVGNRGPILLQHHGKFDPATGTYSPASALIQFKNIKIKEIPPAASVADDGWVTLLDKDFDGMRFKFVDPGNKDAYITKNKNTFKITNGILECSGEPSGYVATEKVYKDYILEADLMFVRPEGLTNYQEFRGNSGILAHVSPGEGIKVWPRSIEVQGYNRQMARILPIPRDLDCPYVSDFDAIDRVRRPLGQWNTMRIETTGNTMTVHLNGTLISTISGGELSSGQIAWQSEGVPTRWRNIRIMEK